MLHQEVEVITCVQRLAEYARRQKSWVVVISPAKSNYSSKLRTLGVGSLPTGTQLSGVTAHLPLGGKLSFVESSYLPFDSDFELLLLGSISSVKDEIGLACWKDKASRVITLNDV